jgi:predicted DNA-binding protein
MDERTKVVSIRLTEGAWERLSTAAAEKGQPLSAYLRARLEQQETAVLGELGAIRQALERLSSGPPPASPTQPQPSDALPEGSADSKQLLSAVLEMLLVLRQVVGPQKSDLAQKELQRRGIAPWR